MKCPGHEPIVIRFACGLTYWTCLLCSQSRWYAKRHRGRISREVAYAVLALWSAHTRGRWGGGLDQAG